MVEPTMFFGYGNSTIWLTMVKPSLTMVEPYPKNIVITMVLFGGRVTAALRGLLCYCTPLVLRGLGWFLTMNSLHRVKMYFVVGID